MSSISSIPEVALLVETSKVYGRELLRGIRHYASIHGPWRLLIEERGFDDPEPAWLDSWKGAGIITRTDEVDRCLAAQERGIPVVDLRYYEKRDNPPFPRVDVDQRRIVEEAITHLRTKGFEEFGFVGLPGMRWSERRREEFLRLCPDGQVVELDDQEGDGPLVDWLSTTSFPIGILAVNDAFGNRVLGCCQQLGLSVPGDVGVVGIDNDELICELAFPTMSSVDQGVHQVGYRAAAILDRLTSDPRAHV